MNAFNSCAYHIPVSSTSCRLFPCTDCSPSLMYYNLISSPWRIEIYLHFGSTSCSTGTQRPTGRAPSCTPLSPCDLWNDSGRRPSAWCRREQCLWWVRGGKRNTSRTHKAWIVLWDVADGCAGCVCEKNVYFRTTRNTCQAVLVWRLTARTLVRIGDKAPARCWCVGCFGMTLFFKIGARDRF